MAEAQECRAPAGGLWRIGRGDNPLEVRLPDPQTLKSTSAGNRFDSPDGSFGVLYFATELSGCFAETLARFRPSLAVQAVVEEEWRRRGFMEVGGVPAEWRQRRTAVRVEIPPEWKFLDIESRHTYQFLRGEIALGLAALGYQDLDVPTVRGHDRRVTRLISDWAYHARDERDHPLYGGIRYLSRIDSGWELWVVFDDVPLQPVETKPILPETEELKKLAAEFGLKVF
jgi:hypothetical protein